jgi:beta-lactamase superfamily II metal-dependent hydrolase
MPSIRFAFCLILFLAGPAFAQGVLTVRFVDVGQGDATLITGPTGKTCLVDGGDVGKGTTVVVPLLQSLGVTQLDYSIASHWHADHYAGLSEVKNAGYGPVVAYDRGLDASLSGQFLYTQYLAAMGGARATMTLGQVVDMGGGATLQCVAVGGQPLGGSPVTLTGTSQIENNRSIVVKLTYGNFHAVSGGDLQGGFSGTADVESVAAAAIGDVDVYKVHHHGSNTSTNSLFLSTIKPEVSIVPCGDNNPYGHPHIAVVNALLALPQTSALYRLRTCEPTTLTPGNPLQQVVAGTLTLTTDGATYSTSGPGVPTVVRNVDEGLPAATYAPLDLVISEFLPNPKGPSGSPIQDVDGEWIEIRNNLPTPVNLLGFTVRDFDFDSFVLPSLVVPGFGAVIVGRNANAAQNGGLVFDYVAPANELILSNSSDEIELVAPNGTVLDTIVYGTGSGIAVPDGYSVERVNTRAPALASNFATSTCCFFPVGATPCVCTGATNQHNYGTPRATNSVDATPPYAFLTTFGSSAPGGLLYLNLSVFGSAGKPFVFAASAATGPPLVLSDGRLIELGYDDLMIFSLTPGNGVFANMTGVMNGFGSAQALVSVPPLPSLSGLGFFVGGLVVDSAQPSGVGSVSKPLSIAIP